MTYNQIMRTFNDIGIVLNSNDLSERDKIISIYTRDHALIKAVAKGAKGSKSKFKGKLENLSCVKLHIAKGKSLDVICDVEQVNSFHSLKKDLSKITYGFLFLEVIKNFSFEEENESPEIFKLIYESLEEMQTTTCIELSAINFLLNFLVMHGIEPQLESCVHCSKDLQLEEIKTQEMVPFSSELGGVLCNSCLDSRHKKIKTSSVELLTKMLRHSEINNDLTSHKSLREAIELLQEHLNERSRKKINSFELLLSL